MKLCTLKFAQDSAEEIIALSDITLTSREAKVVREIIQLICWD